MIFDWYELFSLPEFLATGLVSRTVKVVLEGKGQKDILITQGALTSIVFEDVFLPLQFEDANPFVREGDDGTYAIYKDSDDMIHLGVLVE